MVWFRLYNVPKEQSIPRNNKYSWSINSLQQQKANEKLIIKNLDF